MKNSFSTTKVFVQKTVSKEIFEDQTFIQKLFRRKPKHLCLEVTDIELLVTAKGYTKIVNNLNS